MISSPCVPQLPVRRMIDARSLPNNKTIETDVCIVGAGVGGITLTRELIGAPFRVCLLESGGLTPDKVTQSLYWGENIGQPYFPLDTARARFFGGTSHFWNIPLGDNRLGVRLRSLDALDFRERSWVPYSGWPFDKAHLDPFYERAQDFCQIGPYTYEAADWEDSGRKALGLVGDRVRTAMFQFARREIFFRQYRDEIERAPNIDTFLYANATEIETTESGGEVTQIEVATLEGNRFRVKARLYILTLGGLETPRLLLLSNKVQRSGVGNQNDLIGRFFMEHPHLASGVYVPSTPELFRDAGLYRIHPVNSQPVQGKLALSEEVLTSERILNYCVSLQPTMGPDPRFAMESSQGLDSLKVFCSTLKEGKLPEGGGAHMKNVLGDLGGITRNLYRKGRRLKKIPIFKLHTMSEQVPNPESRVTLAPEHDALGQNRIHLNWQLSPLDMRTIIRAQEIIHEELSRAGLGRIYIELREGTVPEKLRGGWHHMGTARMHDDPKKGVVDRHGRVHGVGNLFVGDSSVFPTSGYANPTLTIVALALRLADHLKILLR